MYKIDVSNLKPGMKVGKEVFNIAGRLLLSKGTILSSQFIDKLEPCGIKEIYVEDEKFSPPQDYIQYRISKKEAIYQDSTKIVRNIVDKIRENQSIDIKGVKDMVGEVVNEIIGDSYAFIQLSSVRDMDNYTYLHSMDVCVYAIILGKGYGMPRSVLNKLGLGAILHDVGKGKVPPEILLKPGPLNDEEFSIMKKHTVWGYEIVNGCYNIEETISNIVLQHHEHWDGNGYPMGLKGYEIDFFSRIVTICDIYDALTGDRVYRKRVLPHEAAEYIINTSGNITDPNLIKNFVRDVAVYPVGTTVILNTGEIGRVSKINDSMPLRPVIEIYSNVNPNDRDVKRCNVNLMENLTLFIEDVIS